MLKPINKLVRDRIPEIIKSDGKIPNTKILEEEEFKKELEKKLKEEVDEFIADYSNDELADIYEILYAFADLNGISIEELENIRKSKADKNGGFSKRIFLETVNTPE